jgi:hypothetical protein
MSKSELEKSEFFDFTFQFSTCFCEGSLKVQMPFINEKQVILRDVQSNLCTAILNHASADSSDDTDSDMDEDIDILIYLSAYIQSRRYISDRIPRFKTHEFRESLFNLSPADLKQEIRVDLASFDAVYTEVPYNRFLA